ncbi:DUF4407 domain-containing protein [Cyclobacterium jeungdonense]|uniref:DUF4407 domain-containing protein n=1 Tax=Cyclobacterium jeungdonense TaxID=708087 RepID=A0ABT8C898_9BACT|nr:DUF4407 domain-containing protein [Cyclobacterium jeungdonense]MDN3688626.1 DUF4407 domain-containing protein [Cyclobacterium jeungdonense]
MHNVEKFLIFCSGAYLPLVRRCPASINRFIGIGTTVLFTAIFAGLSVGYALSTVFTSFWVILVIALIWALMIFNLDRYIVSTIKKQDQFFPEFKQALPRLVLALLIALVIAKPLELRIFEKEINRELDEQRLATIETSREKIAEGYPEINDLESKIEGLRAGIAAKEDFRNQKQKEYDQERFGVKTEGTTGLAGIGVNAEKKEKQLDQAEQDYQYTQKLNEGRIQDLEAEIRRINVLKEQEFQNQMVSLDAYDGLAARLQTFRDLTLKNTAIYWANWMIIFLFIMIEMAPILVKLMGSRGPYDQLLDFHEAGIVLAGEEQWYKKTKEGQLRREVFDELYPRKKSQRIAGETIW